MKKSAEDEIATYRMYTNKRRISSKRTLALAFTKFSLFSFYHWGFFSPPGYSENKLHLTVNCCEDGKGRVRSPPQLALDSGSLELQRRFPGCSHPTGVPRSRLYLRPTHSGEIQGSVSAGPWYRDTKHPSARHAMPCALGAGGLDRGVRFRPKPRPSSSLRAVLQQGHPHGPYRGCSERCTASARGHREGAPRPHPSPSPPLPSRPRTPSVGDCSLADSTPQQAALSIMLSITASLQSMDGGPPTALAAGLGRAGPVPCVSHPPGAEAYGGRWVSVQGAGQRSACRPRVFPAAGARLGSAQTLPPARPRGRAGRPAVPPPGARWR